MPAKNLSRINEDGVYLHIYNKGVEKRAIFNDEEDYQTFLSYLQDYLSTPKDPESVKKDFKVNGRTFRGVPHQPKNYFDKVELVAYSLKPDHYHLLLHQKEHGSLENFIRSLCTRYSIYFNKKYQRTGALFDGPYKSVQVMDEPQLLHLTRYLHHASNYSSYPEYLGTRITSWVKSNIILPVFDKENGSYQEFVEKFGLDPKETEFIDGLTFENNSQHSGIVENPPEIPVESPEVYLVNLKPHQRIPESIAMLAIFALLLTVGIRHIDASSNQNPNPLSILGISTTEPPKPTITNPIVVKEATPSATPESSSSAVPEATSSAVPEATTSAVPKNVVVVRTNDESVIINIHQKPSTDSKTIGHAKDGDIFESVSLNSGWYEIKLADGSTGFIASTYIGKGTNH